jgi:DNA-binding transcriptional LysR family regulator
VSHRIKNLEELWGEDLFVRTGTALRLTAAGTRYLRSVQDALKSLHELARPEFSKQRARLRVAIPPTFGRQHLVPRLPEFNALYPHIDLELHLSIPFLDVKAEDTDVEIRYGSGRYPDLKTTLLLNEPVFPACGRGYFEQISGNTITEPSQLLNHRPDAGGGGVQPGRGAGAAGHGAQLAGLGTDRAAAGHRIGVAACLLHRPARAGADEARGAAFCGLAAWAGVVGRGCQTSGPAAMR